MRIPPGTAAAAATALAVAAAVQLALFAILAGTDAAEWRSLMDSNVLTTAAIALPLAAVGALVVRQDGRHTLGWIFTVLGQLAAGASLAAVWADRGLAPHAPAVAFAAYLWVPALLLAVSTLTLYFPDGRLPSARWRPIAAVAWTVTGLGTAGQLFIAPPLEDSDPLVHSPLTLHNVDPGASQAVFTVLTLLAAGCFLAGLGGLVVRAVRTPGGDRGALWWMAGAFAAMLAGAQFGPVPNLLGALAVPAGLGIATLRYGMYDGDRWRGRAALHGVATVLLMAVVALPVGLLGARLGGGGLGAVLAAVVVGLGIAPAQLWARRGVDRLFFGDRLQPYAAITLAGETGPAAWIGQRGGHTEVLALVHGGRRVGELEVGVPAGQRVLDAGDRALLKDLAAQSGASVGAVLLNRELLRSRERLVVAREEERRRLRRDLHDGLGPTLAGVALGIDAARRAAERSGFAGGLGLDSIHADVEQGLDDLKRVVARLRPAALDDLGLTASLRDYATVLTGSGRMQVSVDCPRPLPELPAAVEAAAYFVAREAMNNAARHSHGSLCRVSLGFGDSLEVSVTDDGCGINRCGDAGGPAGGPGVGIGSMRERAGELGGECEIVRLPAGGTCVRARIPVHP